MSFLMVVLLHYSVKDLSRWNLCIIFYGVLNRSKAYNFYLAKDSALNESVIIADPESADSGESIPFLLLFNVKNV